MSVSYVQCVPRPHCSPKIHICQAGLSIAVDQYCRSTPLCLYAIWQREPADGRSAHVPRRFCSLLQHSSEEGGIAHAFRIASEEDELGHSTRLRWLHCGGYRIASSRILAEP